MNTYTKINILFIWSKFIFAYVKIEKIISLLISTPVLK